MDRVRIDKRRLGMWGERIAADYLTALGYSVVAANYRTRLGEIDLIARFDRYIVFAEVKLRRDKYYAHAMEFVGAAKQARIIAAAENWLQETNTQLQPRFDVVEVYAPSGDRTPKPRVNHVINAFPK